MVTDGTSGTVTWRQLLADAGDALRVVAPDGPDGEDETDPMLDAARIVAEAAGVEDRELFMVLDELATSTSWSTVAC